MLNGSSSELQFYMALLTDWVGGRYPFCRLVVEYPSPLWSKGYALLHIEVLMLHGYSIIALPSGISLCLVCCFLTWFPSSWLKKNQTNAYFGMKFPMACTVLLVLKRFYWKWKPWKEIAEHLRTWFPLAFMFQRSQLLAWNFPGIGPDFTNSQMEKGAASIP